MCSLQNGPGSPKPYDYLLKFLLVGDSDVGKEELLSGMEDGATESPYPSTDGKDCRRVLIDLCCMLSLSTDQYVQHLCLVLQVL